MVIKYHISNFSIIIIGHIIKTSICVVEITMDIYKKNMGILVPSKKQFTSPKYYFVHAFSCIHKSINPKYDHMITTDMFLALLLLLPLTGWIVSKPGNRNTKRVRRGCWAWPRSQGKAKTSKNSLKRMMKVCQDISPLFEYLDIE